MGRKEREKMKSRMWWLASAGVVCVGVRVAREGGGYRLAKGGGLKSWRGGPNRVGGGWNERLVSTLAHFVKPATRWKAGSARY